ncbi:hypothetical protein [Dictyobacter kobayashii]|uniref:hypothetical protein n=1 Tax=Dictyobacter kobayashii TaxID=2014872 RepID=UPI0010A974AA|nr:hypothetical protein [Dictyobacter kobayashii]
MEYSLILCYVCRTQNTLHSKFCSSCGADLSQQYATTYDILGTANAVSSASNQEGTNPGARNLVIPPSVPPPPPPPLPPSYQPPTEYASSYLPPTEYALPYPPPTEYASAGAGAPGQPQTPLSSVPNAPMNATVPGILKVFGVLGTVVSAGLLFIGIIGSFASFTSFSAYTSFATELWVGAFTIILGWILLRISLWPFHKPLKSDGTPASFWRHAGMEGGIFLGGAMVLTSVVCTFLIIYMYYIVNHQADLYSAGVGGSVLYATSGLYIMFNSRLKPPRIDFSQRRQAIALTGSLLGASFGVPGLLMILSFGGGTMVPGAILLVIGVFLTFITRIRK